MKLENKQLNKSAQPWIKRIEKKYSPKLDYYSELRSWMECVMLQAEKNKDSKKKNQSMNLLEDLEHQKRETREVAQKIKD